MLHLVLQRGIIAAILGAVLLGGVGCDGDHHPASEVISRLEVQLTSDGRVELTERNQKPILRRGSAQALVELAGTQQSLSSSACDSTWEDDVWPSQRSHYFDQVAGKRWTCAQNGILLAWRVFHDKAHDTLIAQLHAENHSGSEARLLRLTPLMTEGSEGGLFVGDDARRLRILDNGSDVAIDVDSKLHYPSEPRNLLLDALLPIASRGDVVSNWNHAIFDRDSHRSWIAGGLAVEHSFVTLGTRGGVNAPRFGDRTGLEFYADNALHFRGKRLADGEAIDSEWMYFAPLAADPWAGLEAYADAVAAWQDITVWTKRGGGRRVPTGWNSWSGGGGTGGLGTNIDEQVMIENLEIMAREFEPFGVDYFQMDDGYQQAKGDWYPRPDTFPSGMAAWSERVQERGLLPGLWIAAFTVDESSQLFAQHPEWMARRRDNALGPLLTPGAGERVLDLSNDAVLDWIDDTMHRYKDDWQMRWLKLDFAYQALPYAPPESRLTAIEAYKRAIRRVREALGDDVFYLGIGVMGVNYGVTDGMRLTLDNGPRWEEDNPFALISDGRSFKSTVRTGARRYYLHNRVWINHNDLLFFRTDPEHPNPPVTTDEAVTFASFIGLSGSIVKFGEDLRTLTPQQIQIWRQLLPVYPATARPLDLFDRMYPEQWALSIEGTMAGASSSWKVLGLLNWGRNYDYSTDTDLTEVADASRDYSVDLSDLGLSPERDYLAHEFWTQTFVGIERGRLEYTVPAHGHAVIVLREASGHPQFLGTNRHFTEGATDLVSETWDDDRRVLSLTFDVDQGGAQALPFEYRIQVFVPPGFTLREAHSGAASVTQEGQVLTIALTPSAPQRVSFALRF